jgi:hypothetical protein
MIGPRPWRYVVKVYGSDHPWQTTTDFDKASMLSAKEWSVFIEQYDGDHDDYCKFDFMLCNTGKFRDE